MSNERDKVFQARVLACDLGRGVAGRHVEEREGAGWRVGGGKVVQGMRLMFRD